MVDETEQRWLIQKGRLDFGPFSLTEIRQLIDRNEVLPEHVIIDNDSGRRGQIGEHPLLGDLVNQAAAKRDEHRRVNAEATMVKHDRRKGVALYGFIALGVVGLAAGGYFGLKKLRAAEKKGPSELAALEGAELNVTFELKPQKPRVPGGKRRPGQARPEGSKGGWDDSLDLGDASEDDGDSERLDNSVLSKVIQTEGRGLGRCLAGSGSRKAEIEFIVAGKTGKVTSVRVNGETDGGLANCVRKGMQAMSFPTFNGPRTRGSFEMGI